MNKYKVIISERAKQMLATHIGFVAKINKESARKTRKKLIESLYSLEVQPQRYPFFDEIYIPPNKYHKMYVEKWYLILYQIKDNTIYVDYILDCRQDYSHLLK